MTGRTAGVASLQPIYPRIVQGELPRAADFTPALASLLTSKHADSRESRESRPASPSAATRLPPLRPTLLAKTPASSLADLHVVDEVPAFAITVLNGFLLDATSQFAAFLTHCPDNAWGNTITVLNFLEILCRQHQVALLFDISHLFLGNGRYPDKKSLQSHMDRCFVLRSKMIAQWNNSTMEKRNVVIHFPAFSVCDRIRYVTKNVSQHQRNHAGRLVSALRFNTDVIFISATPPENDALLNMALCYIKSSAKYPNAFSHIHIIHPECSRLLTGMSSSAPALYASIRSMSQIKKLCNDANAHIVPFVAGPYEYRIASELKIPLLCLSLNEQTYLRSKTGSRQLLISAGVALLPGIADIKSEQQLGSALLNLVCENQNVQIWVLKIGDEAERRGLAYFETNQLSTLLQRVQATYINNTQPRKSRTEDEKGREVLREVKTKLRLVLPSIYGGIDSYLSSFFNSGGLVEALPIVTEQEVMLLPTLCFYLEPNGKLTLSCSHENLWITPFNPIATLVPQRRAPIKELVVPALAIARKCAQQGVIGYITIDFAVVMCKDLQTVKQCWVVDFKPFLTESCAMDTFCHILIDGSIDFPVINVMKEDSTESLFRSQSKDNQKQKTEDDDNKRVENSDPLFEGRRFPHQSGLLVTSFSHLRPSTLQFANRVRWLDKNRLRDAENRALLAHNWREADDARSCILIHKTKHPHLSKLGATILNAMLRSSGIALDDQFHIGSLFLPVKDSIDDVCCLISINRTVTSALDNVLVALGSVYTRSTSSKSYAQQCNFKSIVESLLVLLESTSKLDKADFQQSDDTVDLSEIQESDVVSPELKNLSISSLEEKERVFESNLGSEISLRESVTTSETVTTKSDTDRVESTDTPKDDNGQDSFLKLLRTLVLLSNNSQFTHVNHTDIEEQARQHQEDAAVLYRATLLAQELKTFEDAKRDFAIEIENSLAAQQIMTEENSRVVTSQKERMIDRQERRKNMKLARRELLQNSTLLSQDMNNEYPGEWLEELSEGGYETDETFDTDDSEEDYEENMTKVIDNKANTAVQIMQHMFSEKFKP